jgi:adhesin transport system membrane fusion protein
MRFTVKSFDAASLSWLLTTTNVIFLLLLVFLGWAAFFELDQAVRAQGKLIPADHTQIIQVADGGVLSRVLVQEGDTVVSGQPLAELEKERANASFTESRAKQASLEIALIRAQAEADQKTPYFGKDYVDFPQFQTLQMAFYNQRKRSLSQDLDNLSETIASAQHELELNKKLFTTGDTSQLEVMRAQRQVTELQGRINAVRNKYLQDARSEAAKIAEDLSTNYYRLQERQSVLDHTTITAPVAGVVKYQRVTTIGGVLRQGDELMQISPTDTEPVFEVNINPADIGQLKAGLPATIRLDAFDYSIYGVLHGTLRYISSDTLTEQAPNGQANTFYRAQVSLHADDAKKHPKLTAAMLKPGMTATVDLKTGGRSVLKYLIKPVYKAFGGAMTEK